MKTSTTRKPAAAYARPIAQAAYRAAMNIVTARINYAEALNGIHEILNRASVDVTDAGQYGDTVGKQAGNMVQVISRLTDNMRLDLLVQYAAAIDTNTAVLAALRGELTAEELVVLASYEAIG